MLERHVATLVCAVALSVPTQLRAADQVYPVKSIRLVVTAAGGPSDNVGRFVGNGLTERIGQQIVTDPRGGANGIIGTEIVSKAPADGYTLLITTGSFVINPSLYRKLPYDPLKDFAPITLVATSGGLVMCAHPSVPAKTVQELIELDRRKPGEITFASAGVGNTLHMAGELFNIMAGTRLNHVPYKGSAPVLTDLLGGHVSIMFPSTVIATPQVRAGKLRALAFTGLTRSHLLPQVPTLDELGLKGFDITGWYGIFAPANTPRERMLYLQQQIAATVKAPPAREILLGWGLTAIAAPPEDFALFIRKEMDKYARIVREANIPRS